MQYFKIFVILAACMLLVHGGVVEIVRYEYEHLPNNGYKYSFDLSDGQYRDEEGSFKKIGENLVLTVTGSYGYTGADGKQYKFRYTADENGYRVSPDDVTIVSEVPAFGISPALIASLAG